MKTGTEFSTPDAAQPKHGVGERLRTAAHRLIGKFVVSMGDSKTPGVALLDDLPVAAHRGFIGSEAGRQAYMDDLHGDVAPHNSLVRNGVIAARPTTPMPPQSHPHV